MSSISLSDVVDITPSWEWLCETFPSGFDYDDDQYWDWIQSQTDVYFYERPRCSFDYYEAKALAAEAGFSKLIVSNLS